MGQFDKILENSESSKKINDNVPNILSGVFIDGQEVIMNDEEWRQHLASQGKPYREPVRGGGP